uniref:Interferon-related developmental regulator N-terminal domain-containing protein n=1 Tax=Ciona savignyi TaxID=51511 RepID=H2YG16_CIOSA
MPKNKSKKGKGRGFQNKGMTSDLLKAGESTNLQDDETLSEISSVATANSDHCTEESAASDGIAEPASSEDVEMKLKESIDGLSEKTAKYRQSCLAVIRKSLYTTWLVDFLENFRETLSDGVERCLKKGKGEEQSLAAEVVAMLCVQYGAQAEGEEIFNHFKPILTTIILDKSASPTARSKCCLVLGILAFLASDDMEDVLQCMDSFDTVFRNSFLKGDKSVPTHTPAQMDLHVSALSSWALLLSITPWLKVKEFAEKRLPRLPELLQCKDVMMRITAGETIALFFEILRSEEAEGMASRLVSKRELVEDLSELATDSNKYRAKKDRRHQRSSFRDILRAVQIGESPEDVIKFNSEVLYLDTWTMKRQYANLKEVISTGMNFHLKENSLLRNIFQLGPSLLDSNRNTKGSHFERHLYNQAVFKARSKVRGKQRDKRTGLGT